MFFDEQKINSRCLKKRTEIFFRGNIFHCFAQCTKLFITFDLHLLWNVTGFSFHKVAWSQEHDEVMVSFFFFIFSPRLLEGLRWFRAVPCRRLSVVVTLHTNWLHFAAPPHNWHDCQLFYYIFFFIKLKKRMKKTNKNQLPRQQTCPTWSRPVRGSSNGTPSPC